MSEQLRFQGRFIKQKPLENKLKAVAHMNKAKRDKKEREKADYAVNNLLVGQNVVELGMLAKFLKCCNCNKTLSLENTVEKRTSGLDCILEVNCVDCSMITRVPTGKMHLTRNHQKHSDTTTKAILGAVHTGIGCTALNKLLACLNILGISANLYKRYEREIGPIIEEIAKESCNRAAEEERALVIENMHKLSQELPEEIVNEIYPQLAILRASANSSSPECITEEDALNNNTEEIRNTRYDAALGDIINIIVSYDMGWSRRGNGKSYDSLNGYGTNIGFLSGKILDFASRNRKCRRCDKGHAKSDHDCRQNFRGSAKAMEPSVGAELFNNSSILKEVGVKPRVLIADEDSSTTATIRRENAEQIFKLVDTNHLRKHFGTDLFEAKKRFKELRRKGTIAGLKKYFGFAVQKNKGKAPAIAASLRSIPDHVFNQHENCGSWCKRGDKSPENSKPQKIILQDPELHSELRNIFEKYAANAAKFSIAASSQGNESVNGMMAHKAPKNHCLSLSESCDYRLGSVVLTKNEGEIYVTTANEKLSLSPGKNTVSFMEKIDKNRLERAKKAKLPATKHRRNVLAQKREELRKKTENSEGIQYQSNCGMEIDAQNCSIPFDLEILNAQLPATSTSTETFDFVYFDLETSGFKKTSDILQIAAKFGERTFSVYIKPSQPIDPDATKVTGLRNIDGELFLYYKHLDSIPLAEALIAFLEFLNLSSNPCILVAHNASFDISFLLRDIVNNSMIESFQNITGFSDTLTLLKKRFPERKGTGMFKLENLARDLLKLELSEKFHEAAYDVEVLEKLTSTFLASNDLITNSKSYKEAMAIQIMTPRLSLLKSVVSPPIFKKMAIAGITYDVLKKSYAECGRAGIVQLLGEESDSKKPRVTKNKRVVDKIILYLETK